MTSFLDHGSAGFRSTSWITPGLVGVHPRDNGKCWTPTPSSFSDGYLGPLGPALPCHPFVFLPGFHEVEDPCLMTTALPPWLLGSAERPEVGTKEYYVGPISV